MDFFFSKIDQCWINISHLIFQSEAHSIELVSSNEKNKTKQKQTWKTYLHWKTKMVFSDKINLCVNFE